MTAPAKLLLIDGHSLAFRSYYAFAKGREGGLRTSTGIPTSVCYGFLKSLIDTLHVEQPEYMAIAFDLGGPTYRHDIDPTYKAGRAETPEDFIPDLENLQELLLALNLPIVIAPGYEADDVIGTLTRQASRQGWHVKILSGDRDLFQLVDEAGTVRVLYLTSAYGAARTNAIAQEFGPAEVLTKLGVRPDQVVDYKALCGDSSDNIPGVKGIGPKTAVDLLTRYDTLIQVYDHLADIKGATQKKLIEGRDSARHSQYMAQIHLDVPLAENLQDFRLQGFDPQTVAPILEKLEFQSFLRQLPDLNQRLGGSVAATAQTQAVADDEDLWFFSAEDTAPPTLIAPQIIDTPAQLAELVTQLQHYTDPNQPVAWDTETTSLSPRDAQLVGIGCCWANAPDAIAYIPIGHTEGTNLPLPDVLAALKPILESTAYPKACQNAKYDRLVLQFQGIQLTGVVFDTMLASYVINPETSHNLTDLSNRYLGLTAQSYTELVPKGKTIADIEIARVADYCGMDVYTTYQLVAKLRADLGQHPQLLKLLTDVELPLEPVLAQMETVGIRIDQAYLHTFSAQLEQDLQRLEGQAHDLAREPFNLGSPKQLGEILFQKLGLDAKKSRKTKLGYSTDAATLEKLQGDHPLIDILLEYRTLAKLKSTYVDALPNLVRPDTQRVHTDFNQAVTATGRLSSSNPNLQNIPIRTAFSRQIRAAFLPEPGWTLLSADYSQIELRILAHLSEEPRLVEAYRQNQDVHTLTAQLLLEKDTISAEERRLAKIINFGVIYGMGAQRFAREAGVPYGEAKTFIERFYERYPGVFAYLQRMERQAIAQGYVETLLGRRRYFQFDSSSLQKLRGQDPAAIADLDLNALKMTPYERGLLRAAANAPIQGSSADLIKMAMVQLHGAIAPYQAHLLLQVHDELVLEAHPQDLDPVKVAIRTAMETVLPLKVPLVAEVHTGPNWMSAK
ncbi:MAG: DNA polymerase I [Thermosynechococcaceae cyanobacterium]